jgi:hypothetical protein
MVAGTTEGVETASRNPMRALAGWRRGEFMAGVLQGFRMWWSIVVSIP